MRSRITKRFALILEAAFRCVLWVADHPELYRLREAGHRRISLRVFPYYVPCVNRGETLWILAIAQSGRKPLYWVSRRNQAGQADIAE